MASLFEIVGQYRRAANDLRDSIRRLEDALRERFPGDHVEVTHGRLKIRWTGSRLDVEDSTLGLRSIHNVSLTDLIAIASKLDEIPSALLRDQEDLP